MTRQHQVLGVKVGCGTMAVKRRWRELAAQHHPDKQAGKENEFSAYNTARKAVMAYEADLEATCPSCQGMGFLVSTRGFASLKLPCAQCGGAGKFER